MVHMVHHIKPSSVSSYLSGICNELELFYPNVHKNHCHHLVTKTLQCYKKLWSIPTMQKQPLTHPELTKLQDEYMSSNSHDNLLFFVILLVSFHALMCLGKLVWLDKPCIIPQKVSTHDSVELLPKGFSFFLLGHKADCFFEGNRVIPQYNSSGDDPDEPFQKYLKSCSLLSIHNSGFMKMALSPPIAGLFINCVTIFPLTSLVYGCQGGSGLFFFGFGFGFQVQNF